MKSRHWLWLLVLPLLIVGLLRLKLNVEVLDLVPQNPPAVQRLKLYQTNFANARELILTVRASIAAQADAAGRAFGLALRAATNLTTSATWQPLWLERPGESAELLAHRWLNQPPEIFGVLTNRLAAAHLPAVLRDAREALTGSLSPADIARRGYDPLNLTQLPAAATGGNAFGDGQDFFSSADGTFRVLFVTEVLLSLATLAFSGLALAMIMSLAGWSWNLLNLMALPLLLGAGVDYSIHMQLGLRRHGGDLAVTRRSVGRALLLCAGTTVAGFASNIWSSNAGLTSLGLVCATGIACAYLTTNYLLPIW